jgi:hypothetical protein
MKPVLPWVVAGAIGAGAGFWLRDSQLANHAASAQAKAQAIKDAMGPPPGETVVHTFADDAQVREFARLWQQRHALIVRANALETYWNTEQAILTQLNAQLSSQYGLDPAKSYTFNADQRTLVERPSAEPAEDTAAAAQPEARREPAQKQKGAPAAQADEAAAAQHVVHTFPDAEAVQVFAKLWQQRQAALARMAVLQTYRDAEQAALKQLDGTLVSTYQMNMTRTYRLDETRRILIELPQQAPAGASVQPPAAQASEPAAASPPSAPTTAP